MRYIQRFSLLIFVVLSGILIFMIDFLTPENNALQNQDALSLNQWRRQQRLPIIEEGWIKEVKSKSSEKWHDGIRGINSSDPIHLFKEIVQDDDSAWIEKDAFHFECSDSLQYRIIIYNRFSRSADTIMRIQNELIFYHPKEFPPSHSESLTNKDADSVFHAWRLKF